jgi:general secretion pathway protein K
MNRRGSVLIVSLWMLTLLGLVSGALAYTAGVENRLAGRQWDQMRLYAAARNAVSLALEDLKQVPLPRRALSQEWGHSPERFLDRSLGGEDTFRLEREAEEAVLNGFEDENARINVNTAPPSLLETVFGDETLVQAVEDWRDPDSAARPSGAEKEDTPGYLPRNGPFRRVEELLLVKGMSAAFFKQVEPFLTVYGNGRVNVNTASSNVLEALGLEPSLAEKILLFRRGKDGVLGSGDDGVVTALTALPSSFQEQGGLTAEEGASLQKVMQAGFLSTESDALSMNLRVSLDKGRVAGRYRVVAVPRPGKEPDILSWREEPL